MNTPLNNQPGVDRSVVLWAHMGAKEGGENTSVQTLRERYVKARKRHWCSLCLGSIDPGQRYHRSTNVYDGDIYDFLTCGACETDRILIRRRRDATTTKQEGSNDK